MRDYLMSGDREFVLTLSCRDTKGIVCGVSGLLFEAGCNILDSQQFGDVTNADGTGHSLSPEAFTAVGRDVACVVPARAVRWHVEHRVPMNGHKTVVFQ